MYNRYLLCVKMLPHPVTNRTLSVLGAQQETSHAVVTGREHPKILVYTVYVYVGTYAAYMERPETVIKIRSIWKKSLYLSNTWWGA